MKFSIITCTLNSEAWLEESIRSVEAQTGVDIERIFVDGGSVDGTLERVARLAKTDPCVKVLHDVRGGIARAMNAGAEAASGDVVAHLHSDDVYLGSSALSTVESVFDANPDARWVVGRCAALVEGRIVENRYQTKPFNWHELIRGNIVPHPSTFVRREFFLDSGGFSSKLRYAMDHDLWLRLARRSLPVQIPDYLSAFRFHGESASTANPWASHLEDLRVRLHHASCAPRECAEHFGRFTVRSLRLYKAIRRGEGVLGA